MTELTRLFIDLCRISSPSGEEAKIRKFILGWINRELPMVQPETDQFGNIFFRIDGMGEPRFFCAHLDTVGPCADVSPIIDGKYIRSNGSTILGADNKNAIVSILMALKSILNAPNHRPIEVLLTTSEETGNYGAVGFNKALLKSQVGYIFDAGSDLGAIVSASPFYARFDIVVRGKSAHAGYYRQARPAIPLAIEVLNHIESLRRNDLLVNVGLISGGSARNTVVGSMEFGGEIRCFEENMFYQTVDRLQKISQRKNGYRTSVKVQVENPGYRHSRTAMADLQRMLNSILRQRKRPTISFGCSDANIFNTGKGLTVFNISSGGEHAHTVSERQPIESLHNLGRLVLGLMKL